MDEQIARLNIEHYEKLLKEKIDDVKRNTVIKLLSEEKKKLITLQERRKLANKP